MTDADLAKAVLGGWPDLEVMLLANGLNLNLTVAGPPEAAGLAERLNERLYAIVGEELRRREIPSLNVQPYLRLLTARAVEAILKHDPESVGARPPKGADDA